MRTTSVGVLAGVVTVVLTVAGCGAGSNGGDSGTIRIGGLHPLSGSNAADGQQMDNAAKLAVEAVNAAGGIKALGGAKLELVSADTQGKPEVGQSEAQRLIQGGAVALFGTYQSAVSTNVASVSERNQVPFVIDVTAADSVLQQGYRYSFRMQPTNTGMGANAADYLKQIADAAGRPVKKVAYLHEQTAFGTSVFTAFKARATELGITVAPEIPYDAASVSDLTTQITQVKASGADVLAVTGYYRDSVLAAKAVESVRPALTAVFGVADGAYDLPQFPTDAGAASEGVFDSNYRLDLSSTDCQELATAFRQRFGAEIRTGAVLAYDAVRVIAAGLEKAASRDPKKLRDAIAATDLDPTVVSKGPIRFDEHGENPNAIPVVMQVQNGKVVQVHPANAAESKPRYPGFSTQ